MLIWIFFRLIEHSPYRFGMKTMSLQFAEDGRTTAPHQELSPPIV